MMLKITVRTILLSVTVLFFCISKAQQPAFPGAEGAGKFASGGRGTVATPTTVFEVTNLGDANSPGSLRYACNQSTTTYPYRTIVFRVSGTIHLTSRLTIPKNTTVAGQTAPGDGICLADYPVAINGDNVIVRYIRIRMGDKNQLKTSPSGCGLPVAPFSASCMPIDGSGGDDSFGDLGHKNLIIDHCSVSWSTDEAFTFYRGDSLTLQYNFIEEPLNYSYHFETGDTDFEHHGYGGIQGGRHATIHHNLFAHCQSRNPRFGGNTTYNGDVESADFRNNVIYDWGLYTVYGGEGGQYNLVNNYYKYGPSTGSATKYRIVNVDSNATYGWAQYYLSGNYVDGSPAYTANNWSGAFMLGGKASDSVKSKQTTPFLQTYPQVPAQLATDAYEDVLNNAGAILPRRDTLDQRIVNDVRNRTGRIIDVQGGYPHATPYPQTVNAWPTLNSAPAPMDTDHDGMPDSWETANGLNPSDPADRQTIAVNGYTNLENYLNSITSTSAQIYFSGSLTPFSQTGTTPSAVQTVSLSGTGLSADVMLTAPDGFEISVNGGTTWATGANAITLTQSGGSLAATTLSIRLNSLASGNYSGNIVATSGSAAFYLAVSGDRDNVAASSPATATWTLLSNGDATVSGAVTATSQALGSAMAGTSYGNTFGGVSGWQRVATTSFLPVGYNANSYVEYTITPEAGKTFVDTAITLSALGGGTGTARMAIYYSKDGFATSQSIGTITYNAINYSNTTDNTNSVSLLNTSTTPLTGQQIARASTYISATPSETLSIRVYAWITGSGNRYFTSQNVTVSGYTTAGDPSLPLKLLQFAAALENKQVRLLWETTNEVNAAKFVVESSADAVHFTSIGNVAAKNNAGNNKYGLTDPTLLDGIRYYRLKMIDNDGRISYSNVAVVNANKSGSLSVFPNPATNNITITYPKVGEHRKLQLFAADGRLLQTVFLAVGTIQTTLDVNSLSKGGYFIRLEEGQQTTSFIKQ